MKPWRFIDYKSFNFFISFITKYREKFVKFSIFRFQILIENKIVPSNGVKRNKKNKKLAKQHPWTIRNKDDGISQFCKMPQKNFQFFDSKF